MLNIWKYMCNDRTFCVSILRGHGVVGRYIVVLGHSCRMFGCLGNLVMGLPRRQWRQAAPRGGESVLSRALQRADVLKIYVSLLCYIVNFRNYEYYTACGISMCSSMDLSMYSNVYEDCIMNPGWDKC